MFHYKYLALDQGNIDLFQIFCACIYAVCYISDIRNDAISYIFKNTITDARIL